MTSGTPQMFIPEKDMTTGYFEFSMDALSGFDRVWNDGQKKQPVSGSWVVPSSKDFLSIFPSTPYAGNIAFNKGDNSKNNLMDWGKRNEGTVQDYSYKIINSDVLRVTVPYYDASNNSAKPAKDNNEYKKAWETLAINHDEGTTHTDYYENGPEQHSEYEPDGGDPEDGYASVYIISFKDGDRFSLSQNFNSDFQIMEWGTIYGIKRIYTDKAYRIRWRALIANEGTKNPSLYIEICRYRCNANTTLTEDNFRSYDWDHPAATIYFPVCGLGDHSGQYINYGTECQYATSDLISGSNVSALQIKITGNNAANAYIAVIKNSSNRHFGMQIRPIGGVNNSK